MVAIAVAELWRGRQYVGPRIWLGLMLAATGVWNFALLNRTPDWQPWLRWTVLVGAILVAAVLIVGGHQLGRYTAVLAMAGLLFGLGATAAYTVETVARFARRRHPDLGARAPPVTTASAGPVASAGPAGRTSPPSSCRRC